MVVTDGTMIGGVGVVVVGCAVVVVVVVVGVGVGVSCCSGVVRFIGSDDSIS